MDAEKLVTAARQNFHTIYDIRCTRDRPQSWGLYGWASLPRRCSKHRHRYKWYSFDFIALSCYCESNADNGTLVANKFPSEAAGPKPYGRNTILLRNVQLYRTIFQNLKRTTFTVAQDFDLYIIIDLKWNEINHYWGIVIISTRLSMGSKHDLLFINNISAGALRDFQQVRPRITVIQCSEWVGNKLLPKGIKYNTQIFSPNVCVNIFYTKSNFKTMLILFELHIYWHHKF